MAGRRYTGADAAMKDLETLQKTSRSQFGDALFTEVDERLVPEARGRTPIDTGELRDSIHAEGPTYVGKKIHVALVADAPYALPVHEDFEASHTTGGPKFIERTLKGNTGRLPGNVGKRVELKP